MAKRGHPIVPSRRHLPQADRWEICTDCNKPCVFPSPCGRCQYCYSQFVHQREMRELAERPNR